VPFSFESYVGSRSPYIAIWLVKWEAVCCYQFALLLVGMQPMPRVHRQNIRDWRHPGLTRMHNTRRVTSSFCPSPHHSEPLYTTLLNRLHDERNTLVLFILVWSFVRIQPTLHGKVASIIRRDGLSVFGILAVAHCLFNTDYQKL